MSMCLCATPAAAAAAQHNTRRQVVAIWKHTKVTNGSLNESKKKTGKAKKNVEKRNRNRKSITEINAAVCCTRQRIMLEEYGANDNLVD